MPAIDDSDLNRAHRMADASLILAHGTDAPDPDDPAEPVGLSQQLESVMAGRLSRRSFVGGALGVAGAAALSGPAMASGDRDGRGSPYRGDAESLNTALDEDYLQHVTASLVAFGDTPSGWRPGGSPANLQAVDWIAAEMKRVGMKKVAKLPVPIDRWFSTGPACLSTEAPPCSRPARGAVYREPRPAASPRK